MSDDEQYDERNADVLYVYLSNAKLPDMGCSQTCKCVLLLSLIAYRKVEMSGSRKKAPGFFCKEEPIKTKSIKTESIKTESIKTEYRKPISMMKRITEGE